MNREFKTAIAPDLLTTIQRGTMAYTYKGLPTLKNPFDLALYQKLLWDAKPRTIIEIGSHVGGSALWFADNVRAMGLGAHIYSLDIKAVADVTDPLVTFITSDVAEIGRSLSSDFVRGLPRPLFIVEDSAHTYEASLIVLRHFADLMLPGERIAVEDSIITPMGTDYDDGYNGGPARAIAEFLKERADFEIDAEFCDYFGYNVTYNVNGFLRRIG